MWCFVVFFVSFGQSIHRVVNSSLRCLADLKSTIGFVCKHSLYTLNPLYPCLCAIIALAAYVGYFENDNDLKLYPNRITERPEGGEKKKEPILPEFFQLQKSRL